MADMWSERAPERAGTCAAAAGGSEARLRTGHSANIQRWRWFARLQAIGCGRDVGCRISPSIVHRLKASEHGHDSDRVGLIGHSHLYVLINAAFNRLQRLPLYFVLLPFSAILCQWSAVGEHASASRSQ